MREQLYFSSSSFLIASTMQLGESTSHVTCSKSSTYSIPNDRIVPQPCHASSCDISHSSCESTGKDSITRTSDDESTPCSASLCKPVQDTFSRLKGIHFNCALRRCFRTRLTQLIGSSSNKIGMATSSAPHSAPASMLLVDEHHEGEPGNSRFANCSSSSGSICPAARGPDTMAASGSLGEPVTASSHPPTTATKSPREEVLACTRTKEQVCTTVGRDSARHRCESPLIHRHKPIGPLTEHYGESESTCGRDGSGSPYRTSARYVGSATVLSAARSQMKRPSFAGVGSHMGSQEAVLARDYRDSSMTHAASHGVEMHPDESSDVPSQAYAHRFSRSDTNVPCAMDSVGATGEGVRSVPPEPPSPDGSTRASWSCSETVPSDSLAAKEGLVRLCKPVSDDDDTDTRSEGEDTLSVSQDTMYSPTVFTPCSDVSAPPVEEGTAVKATTPTRCSTTHLDPHVPLPQRSGKDDDVLLEPLSQRREFVMRANSDYLRHVPHGNVSLEPGHSIVHWSKRVAQRRLRGANRMRQYTPEEVMRHNTADDMWMVIHDTVYDVTEFQHYHPAGRHLLKQCAGRDATDVFNAFHSWISCEAMLGPYAVGKIVKKN